MVKKSSFDQLHAMGTNARLQHYLQRKKTLLRRRNTKLRLLSTVLRPIQLHRLQILAFPVYLLLRPRQPPLLIHARMMVAPTKETSSQGRIGERNALPALQNPHMSVLLFVQLPGLPRRSRRTLSSLQRSPRRIRVLLKSGQFDCRTRRSQTSLKVTSSSTCLLMVLRENISRLSWRRWRSRRSRRSYLRYFLQTTFSTHKYSIIRSVSESNLRLSEWLRERKNERSQSFVQESAGNHTRELYPFWHTACRNH